ncbi:MAG: hypothetical protein QM477_10290 [Planctomycetota bacterium]
MANIATLIKNEIRKETDKAVRNNVRPLLKDLQAERIRVRDLERQVNALTKQLNKVSSQKSAAVPEVRSTFRSSTVGQLRTQHHLSQGSLAKLLGVGLNTVWLWEKGRTRPRVKQQEGLDSIAAMSPLQLKRRLTAVGLSTGKSKPGRKPGSTKAKLAAKKVAVKPAKKAVKKKVLGKKKARKKTSRKK